MSEVKFINPAGLETPAGYSQIVDVQGSRVRLLSMRTANSSAAAISKPKLTKLLKTSRLRSPRSAALQPTSSNSPFLSGT
jgi:hypothetical protein